MANPSLGTHPWTSSYGCKADGSAATALAQAVQGWEHLIYIDGSPLPCEPSTYEANVAALVDSARNAEGVMIGSIIRNDVAKVSTTFRFVSAADWATINSFFTGTNGSFTHYVYFFNQTTNMWEDRQMYVSDRSAGAYLKDSNYFLRGWTECSLNLIEV